MRQHLLRVARGAEAFAGLMEAARQAGQRIGWLELKRPSQWPEELERAAEKGVLRAVAVGGGRSVAVKPLAGEPVLRDLLREHFSGCDLVLVRGDIAGLCAAPRLEPRGEAWEIQVPGASSRELTTDRLVAALRSPHPWTKPESPPKPPEDAARTASKRRKKRK